MNMKSIRNSVSRNGFDLSFKKNFTAKVGELLPVMVKEVLPGDVFNINLSSFTRTQPINTAAFARMREYYDFFFVPYNLLWNKSDTALTQMDENSQHALSLDSSQDFKLIGRVPNFSCQQIANYLTGLLTLSSSDSQVNKNYFGYDRGILTAKLLEYLGYGNFFSYATDVTHTWASKPLMNNIVFNAYSLLAYQKIYADFFRDSQWENISPSTFNVDYMSGVTSPNIDIQFLTSSAKAASSYNMLDLRYCNWQKDLFHGVLPSAQYGSPASVTINSDVSGSSATGSLQIYFLRQVEFMQKWKEIAQSGSKDYKEQVQKHWNVSVGDYASEMCQYLGGINTNLDINEVVNTNITGENAADIAGKGTGAARGSIRFDSQGRYGILMCIYHCLPVLDYTTDFVDPMHTKVYASDYAVPEFDKLGMVPVRLNWLMNADANTYSGVAKVILGYAPRYIEYKTSFDVSVGAFKRSLNSWIMSYDNKSVWDQLTSVFLLPDPPSSLSAFNYSSLKVNPNSVNPIFAVNADSNVDTDQFLCSTFFDIKAVRNLDVDGLPY